MSHNARKGAHNDAVIMSDSNASMEDEDVFTLVRLRAKTQAPTRQVLSVAQSNAVRLPEAGGVDQESDDHTLMLTSQHDSSAPYTKDYTKEGQAGPLSPNAFDRRKRLSQQKSAYNQDKEAVKLLATLRRNTELSERVPSQDNSQQGETLPYVPEGEHDSPMRIESKGRSHDNHSDDNA